MEWRSPGTTLHTSTRHVLFGKNYVQYRSRVELNIDLPTNMSWLMDVMCHEGYPGHHTEFVTKEQHLYREHGYMEQAIAPIIGPQSVISEGIATTAREMIFTLEEAEQWASEHLYPEVGIEPVQLDLVKLHRAGELMQGLGGNAAFLLNEGRPDEEVA